MPENFIQWLWYAFFFGGALGGWIMIGLGIAEIRAAIRDAEWY